MWRLWSGREIDLSLHWATFTYLYTDTSDRFQIGIHIPALLEDLRELICFNNSQTLDLNNFPVLLPLFLK